MVDVIRATIASRRKRIAIVPRGVRTLGAFHAAPLSTIGLACALGQAAILTRKPLIVLTPDSPTYLALGHRLAHEPSLLHLFDAMRTPGYPAFLALVEAMHGGNIGNAIAFAQALLLVGTAFELYVLTYGLTRSRIAGAVVGVVVGTNLFLLDWERTVMTEALAIFTVVTAMTCLWFLMRDGYHWVWAVALAVASVVMVLTRPSLLYLPVVLLAVLAVTGRQRWLLALGLAAAVYVPALGYGVINDRLFRYAGMTAVSNLSPLGKVLEYRMQSEGDAAKFPGLWQAANAVPKDDPNPYRILFSMPEVLGPNQEAAAQFSGDIFRRHPLQYVAHSAQDFAGIWLVLPDAIAPIGFTFASVLPNGSQSWMRPSLAAYDAYLVLPLAIAILVALWRCIERLVALAIAGLALAVIGNFVVTALFAYEAVARQRAPVDPVAMTLVIVVATLVLQRVHGRPEAVIGPDP